MGAVRRLLTFADLDDRDRRGHSISARLVAELVDERHVVLLDDRGWTSGHGGAHTPEEVEMTAGWLLGPTGPGAIRRALRWNQTIGQHWHERSRMGEWPPTALI
jgi:hypothetical protein